MSDEPVLRVDGDRFDRLKRISWWNQARVRDARILVIGAGALGNEILKNLALLGVGRVFVVDLDVVERSNLSRSILFRDRDEGRPKAQVAAESLREIYPDIKVEWFHGDAIFGLGLGVFRWADLAIAGLDNREARLWINRYCWKTNTPWVDGATEIFQGVVRVFVPPHGACYECTLSAADHEALKERRGCDELRVEGLPNAPIPTTPVTASIIAALQCQEALKLLHGMPSLSGEGLVFNGLTNDVYTVKYNADDECNGHERFDEIVSLDRAASTTVAGDLLARARSDLGPTAILELNQEVLTEFHCRGCDRSEPVYRPVGVVLEREATCPRCGMQRQAMKAPSISGSERFVDRTLAELGVPRFDIVAGRRGLRRIGYELSLDASSVLRRVSIEALPQGGTS